MLEKVIVLHDYLSALYRTAIDSGHILDFPWMALMEAVKHSPSVRPLRVLWRTQLNPPKFNVRRFQQDSGVNSVDFAEDWLVF
jgi:hypothetical protein